MPERFLSLIVTMLPALQKMEQRLDRETGRRFNAFNSLFPLDETATSRILAFLLDPKEAHGQGDVFLRAFIQQFIPHWQRTFNFSRAQKDFTRELIDIVISDGTHWMGIENKIFDAPEQMRQAGRYLDELKKNATDLYCLIYLSPKGKGPSEKSYSTKDKKTHGDKLICGAWAQPADYDVQTTRKAASVLDWLAESRTQSEAENVTWLLKQFSAYVVSVTGGQKEVDMADTVIIELALSRQENLEAAFRIGANLEGIKQTVISRFLTRIRDQLNNWARNKGEDWEILERWPEGTWIERPDRPFLAILVRKKLWPTLVGIGISADANGPSQVIFGVTGPTQGEWNDIDNARNVQYFGEHDKFIGRESRQRIMMAIEGPGEQASWWPYYERQLTDQARKNISNWRDLNTVTRLFSEREPLSKFIVSRITDIASKIGSLVIDDT